MDRFAVRPFLGLLALLAVASPATGTPLPNPPFSGGGFIAPSSDVLREEEAFIKLLDKIVRLRATCDWAAVTRLQLAYTPANQTKVESSQDLWTACVQRADAYYASSRDRIVLRATQRGYHSPCLDAAAIDTIRAASEATLASLSSVVYCDADGAAPDPVVGLDIPDKKNEVIGETNVAKVLIKAWHKTTHCYSKAAKTALKRSEHGEDLSTRDLEGIQRCFDRVVAQAEDKIGDLDQQQKLPGCLDTATAEGLVADAMAFIDATTGALYCAE